MFAIYIFNTKTACIRSNDELNGVKNCESINVTLVWFGFFPPQYLKNDALNLISGKLNFCAHCGTSDSFLAVLCLVVALVQYSVCVETLNLVLM